MSDKLTDGVAAHSGLPVAVLSGGCFWCLDAVYRELRGVREVTCGYMGGHLPAPDYEAVCSGTSGHAEVVRIVFDPVQISFRDLLEVFFVIHDPTQLNRQGNDVGTQYRSAIFWLDEAQRNEAAQALTGLAGAFAVPVVTELSPATLFHPAEDYHQDYYRQHPGQGYCAYVVAPKLAKFRTKFVSLLKQDA
ncbi:peptide-methionine (S)-S-oxide reductase MsrA [Uliginosibacterium sp. 31-16]|uniref:peptide-methionine (S)-S-oxide reductase MsrA n=1 Tax=Uliginosibacterium sp. 31-16 TaxID=3068315 RepID=UPI00273E7B49|nr:peptide-methionine (S)-S-oxide reductase MsrA [Uliginosibacterium sp. 31-16]MDP5238371.1 peptide-methionine (S)-S-oxide reductase MsrA [Uliginosibacterium sp. 31-16]